MSMNKQLDTKEKLSQLRRLMKDAGIDYYYVPATDPHHNEYLPACWMRRSWLSGFTGSAGDLLVGLDQAYLWTDPRYFLQAQAELDPNYFQLVHQQQGVAAAIDVWLKQHAAKKRVGTDPKLLSINQSKKWKLALESVGGELVSVEQNLVDAIWHDQPALQAKPIVAWDIRYAGYGAAAKIADVRKEMQLKGVAAHVLTELDAIAWLLNIRGQDISFNPLVISYAIITKDDALFFVNMESVPSEVLAYLATQNVKVASYESFSKALNQLTDLVWVDSQTASYWVLQQLTQASVLLDRSPITLMKARKNPVEIAGMHEAHRKDGIAVCRFLHWLEQHWREGVTEVAAAKVLGDFRKEGAHSRGLSFDTISAFGPHGAIVHYRASPDHDLVITDETLYLIDSGGQYLEGTTDITRTIHLGKPTPEQKHHYTLVLKGHLALRHTLFPQGVCGEQLNVVAHRPLWNEGLDFGHGTGHGVGCYLCVHEGPQRISGATTQIPLTPGMILSNEPGLYLEGRYGIRIENLCVVNELIAQNQSLTNHGPFYGFDDLTKVPYARNLIEVEELTQEEIRWIDEYHQQTYDLLAAELSNDERTWLKNATKPLKNGS